MTRSSQTDRPPPESVDAILAAARRGDDQATGELFALAYDEIHALASAQRRRWDGNETLNTTALVHEAYLKLVRAGSRDWTDRSHFLAVAARAMRQILVNYAERQTAQKRGGHSPRVSLHDVGPVAPECADDLLALHEGLRRLEALNERQARVVECRFFAGLQVDETADALGVSEATVKRDWSMASAWLYRELTGADPG